MGFEESSQPKPVSLTARVAELGLRIAGSRLEPVLGEFRQELHARGVRGIEPVFYLSDEWGVPFGTTAIAIPFYLARTDLLNLHAEQVGHIEGETDLKILRYLRHEMGHVVNYGYKLYEREDWVKTFGAFGQPYVEDYRPEPFSRRFVRHLPGWYAQKHPDEDWAETFAVWLTPGEDWRWEYGDWPEALGKLDYCERVMAEVRDRPPLIQHQDPDDAVDSLKWSLGEYYTGLATEPEELPPGLDGSLRAILEDESEPHSATEPARLPASRLLRKIEQTLMANVYRWTGHFPERTRALLRRMAARADELRQVYPADRELETTVAITTLVTALAMNYVHRGKYAP